MGRVHFAGEKILGRWGYDEFASLQLNKKLKPDVTAPVWFRLKNELTERFDNSVFTAFYDKVKPGLANGPPRPNSHRNIAGRPNCRSTFPSYSLDQVEPSKTCT